MSALREVFRAHQTVATGLGEWCCSCTPREWRPAAHRSRHLEAAVLAWLSERLGSEDVREAVAEDLRNIGHQPPLPSWAEVAFLDVRHAAAGAIESVLAALAGGEGS